MQKYNSSPNLARIFTRNFQKFSIIFFKQLKIRCVKFQLRQKVFQNEIPVKHKVENFWQLHLFLVHLPNGSTAVMVTAIIYSPHVPSSPPHPSEIASQMFLHAFRNNYLRFRHVQLRFSKKQRRFAIRKATSVFA